MSRIENLNERRRGSDADVMARRTMAKRYRGRTGYGCDECPFWCKLADLRPVEPEVFRREYRQAITHSATGRDSYERKLGVYEHNRITCMLQMHDMRRVLDPIFNDPNELRFIRYDAAFLSAGFGFGNDGPRRVLEELAEGSDKVARHARALLLVWDRDGWPEED